MIAELGHFALIIAFVIACVQFTVPMIGVQRGVQRGDHRWMNIASRAANAQAICLILSFLALTMAFIGSDFSVKLVASHSHTHKPLIYKISGVWGNHEGSMMLWVMILSIYGAMFGLFGRALPARLKTLALSVQGLLGAGFLGFVLFTSNPFERLYPMPQNGHGLNPLLQDIGLAIHPPFLYLGYVGFSMAFSLSIAALIEGRVDAVWARWLRPWVILAWSFLTIGIVLGSVWAYYELGWGGWWMWDPVENVSFLPWIIGTALLHSILVLERRHMFANWTILLGICAFSLSLIGTFVVRSGVLTSVHSFAVDPARGVFILILLAVATGGALTLYALRAQSLRDEQGLTLLSKEGGLILNNILLGVACLTVFLGTFYPLLVEAFSNSKITVGEPYFERTFAPIMVVLIVFMGIGPYLKWRSDQWANIRNFCFWAAIVFAVVSTATWIISDQVFKASVWGALAMGLAAYLGFATLFVFAKKLGYGRALNTKLSLLRRLRAQSVQTYAFVLAHLGMALVMIGVIGMSVWAKEDVQILKVNDSIKLAGYEFTLRETEIGTVQNYQFQTAHITVKRHHKFSHTLSSERRYYPVREMVTSEAGIHVGLWRNLYVGLGEGDADQGYVVRAYVHPLINWIWIGAFMMALAGFVSLLPAKGAGRLRPTAAQSTNGTS